MYVSTINSAPLLSPCWSEWLFSSHIWRRRGRSQFTPEETATTPLPTKLIPEPPCIVSSRRKNSASDKTRRILPCIQARSKSDISLAIRFIFILTVTSATRRRDQSHFTFVRWNAWSLRYSVHRCFPSVFKSSFFFQLLCFILFDCGTQSLVAPRYVRIGNQRSSSRKK